LGCSCVRPVHGGDHPEPSQKYLIGLGTLGERMLILVDIDRLMSGAEMGLIKKMAA
jgi:chemotaxis signal transduction protein